MSNTYTQEFKDCLELARLQLFKRDPFLYSVAARMEIVQALPLPGKDAGIQAYTDGAKIYLCPPWLEKKELDRMSTLVHEVGHIILNHVQRGKHLPHPIDHHTANIAADLALVAMQHRVGAPALITTFYNGWMQFEGMSMEEIYKLIVEDMPEGLKSYDPGHPDIEDASEDEIEAAQIHVNQAALTAQSQGHSTGESTAAARAIEQARARRIPWDVLLQRELSKRKSTQITWSRPNRRLKGVLGGRFPSKKKDYEFKAVMAMDTSGSVGQKALNTFGAVTTDLLHRFASEVHLMTFDTSIVDEWHLTKGAKCHELELSGGGGTDVEVVYKHLEKLEVTPHLLIIATDAWIHVPPDPGYPVIWLVSDNMNFKPSYGKVIFLTE